MVTKKKVTKKVVKKAVKKTVKKKLPQLVDTPKTLDEITKLILAQKKAKK